MEHTDLHHADHAHEGSFQSYVNVFILLCVFTAVSFVVNYFVRAGHLSSIMGFALILGVAVVKAVLVAMIFMHLKWDWSKLYFMILPALVLAPMLIFALLPDIVLAWKNLYAAG